MLLQHSFFNSVHKTIIPKEFCYSIQQSEHNIIKQLLFQIIIVCLKWLDSIYKPPHNNNIHLLVRRFMAILSDGHQSKG